MGWLGQKLPFFRTLRLVQVFNRHSGMRIAPLLGLIKGQMRDETLEKLRRF
jgi:hypothetical protein